MTPSEPETLRSYLDSLVATYETPAFIESDPIAIPHAFDDPRDREVVGLYTALLAWGRRRTILDKMALLIELMRHQPYRFVRDFDAVRDGERLSHFKHRTFQPADAVWFTAALSAAMHRFGTVEAVFAHHLRPEDPDVGPAIQGFSETILSILPETPVRLRKHLARPSTGSACKRLAMYLRWMVRPGPVDLGIWTLIRPPQLVLPLDIHSGRSARRLGLIDRPANDWKAVLELTARCRELAPDDPCRYDFALFTPAVQGVSLDIRFTGGKRSSIASPTRR